MSRTLRIAPPCAAGCRRCSGPGGGNGTHMASGPAAAPWFLVVQRVRTHADLRCHHLERNGSDRRVLSGPLAGNAEGHVENAAITGGEVRGDLDGRRDPAVWRRVRRAGGALRAAAVAVGVDAARVTGPGALVLQVVGLEQRRSAVVRDREVAVPAQATIGGVRVSLGGSEQRVARVVLVEDEPYVGLALAVDVELDVLRLVLARHQVVERQVRVRGVQGQVPGAGAAAAGLSVR